MPTESCARLMRICFKCWIQKGCSEVLTSDFSAALKIKLFAFKRALEGSSMGLKKVCEDEDCHLQNQPLGALGGTLNGTLVAYGG